MDNKKLKDELKCLVCGGQMRAIEESTDILLECPNDHRRLMSRCQAEKLIKRVLKL